MNKPRIDASEALWRRAKGIIPAGTQTLSKGPTQFVDGVAPKYLQRGKGCHVWDVDGNRYIDYGMGLHPIILGYCYPAVDEAIKRQLEDGITFTLMHPLEVELAELLIETIPCAESVRYGKNGSDVTSAAVRVARAYTGRDRIALCGYHGWQDWYIGTTERNKGVPAAVRELSHVFEYNDIDSLQALFDAHPGEFAAVIMEPMGVVEPKDDFLNKVKEAAHTHGAIFILDEIITGFRWALGGAQEYFNVTPDLAAFGKCMSNGMPVSALAGKKEIMDQLEEVFFSFTFGGECLSLAASKATITELRDKNVTPFIWAQGAKIRDGFNALAAKAGLAAFVRFVGLPPRTVAAFTGGDHFVDLELKSLFQQECIKRGVLFTGYNAISFAHDDQVVDQTLGVYEEALGVLARAIGDGSIKKFLEGDVVRPVFRKV
ncbi:MAG: aminotransferase class III-fold pyridoxal phosphate-dependent enzyme [Actinomycetota bacterium]|nr:aminotransferase class III-fold pyridoxal phosphate-dependent enzyme [Actinomycetota bacterium]